MSLKIPTSMNLGDGIHEVILRENDHILTIVASDLSVHEKIHDIRKALKKLRAAVRLVRHTSERYIQQNAFYRDLAREISILRDKTAHLECLDKLTDPYTNLFNKRTFARFRKSLEKERDTTYARAFAERDPIYSIEKEIRSHKNELKPFPVASVEDIIPGIRKVYQRGKAAMEKARAHPSTENFHDWRKRTKYLRYQLEMFVAIYPHMITAWEESLHELSNYLGDDHDLAVLAELAQDQHSDIFQHEAEFDLFLALQEFKRRTLQKKAFETGMKIYLDSPETFANRIEKFWNITYE